MKNDGSADKNSEFANKSWSWNAQHAHNNFLHVSGYL